MCQYYIAQFKYLVCNAPLRRCYKAVHLFLTYDVSHVTLTAYLDEDMQ